MAFAACGRTEVQIKELSFETAWKSFSAVMEKIRSYDFAPAAVYNGEKGVEYAYLPLHQYTGMTQTGFDSFSALLLSYFATKEETVNLRS